jgi:hypothetical protein
MFSLHALAHLIGYHILRNINLHSLPPEVLLQIHVHFGFARVNGVRRFMSFSQCNTSGVTMARAHLGTKDCDHMW